MSKWADLFEILPSDDLEKLISIGVEKTINADTLLIKEDNPMDHLHCVIKGLFKITNDFLGNKPLTLLGPGEIIGAVSFIDNMNTNVSVIAVEESVIISISHESLKAFIKKNTDFGLRLYKALANITAMRLRKTSSRLGNAWTEKQNKESEDIDSYWNQFNQEMDIFKELIADCDKRAIKNGNSIQQSDVYEIQNKFKYLYLKFNKIMENGAQVPAPIKNKIGKIIKKDFLPYMLLTNSGERFYSKPRGYAGDFYTIEMIYQNNPGGSGRVGPVLDSCFLNLPAAQAVRNRRGLLVREIEKTISQNNKINTKIMSIACGPSREIIDVYDKMNDISKLESTLLDLDKEALIFVDKKVSEKKIKKQIKFLNENIVYLILGKKIIDLEKQHLIYSIGLIDYFKDNIVIKLLNYIYKHLHSNGRVLLGNFHPSNTTKAFMDHVLDWPLIHRNEQDMNRLFIASDFKKECSNIYFEDEGINLFAECKRD